MDRVWRTQSDILKDLKEVSGSANDDFDNYLVIGERPPPVRRDIEDEDEILMQYYGGPSSALSHGDQGPDLLGISTMLQIVNAEDHDDNEPNTLFRDSRTDMISISKLNPSVQEFTPKSNSNSSPKKVYQNNFIQSKEKKMVNRVHQNNVGNNNNASIKLSSRKVSEGIVPNSTNESSNVTSKMTTPTAKACKQSIANEQLTRKVIDNTIEHSIFPVSTTDNNISLNKTVTEPKVKSEDIQAMKENLKAKISLSSKTDNRREKNVAIAALLKLCTTPAAVDHSSSRVEKPIKLVTPEYFKSSSANNKTEKTDAPEEYTKEENFNGFGSIDNKITSIELSPQTSSHSEQESSRLKVNNWFYKNENRNEKLKHNTPPKPLGKITFKKKDSVQGTQSTVSSEISGEKKSSWNAYVPSQYANELLKKYESQIKKVPMKDDLGTMTEKMCKERDAIIRKKMLEKQNQVSDR